MNARTTDPDTSHKAAAKDRTPLRERLYNLIKRNVTVGATGTAAAEILGAPLNSVTPRFAELRKAHRIKDSGQRRNGQIVWLATAGPDEFTAERVVYQGEVYVPVRKLGCMGCAFSGEAMQLACSKAPCFNPSQIFVKAS